MDCKAHYNMLKRIQAKHGQNSSEKDCKTIKDKVIEELIIKSKQARHSILLLSSAPEKMKKDDFEIVVFSDENDEKDNEMENN
ncbi:uncharacterized protein CIMG_12826 [Coccidioides immitis RS]|uniref:Uncharacterized protein n=1 Tax=Coccidioides immitis (strain RS) TaxID=246410 RepID=A0A0D8JVE9_COCIM|nr:uncharacterized protein CIMG_12826 [Coccidioides immitis RS]KJF60253.1 hypothetical protein CIMG_12826 [Coccidioides immitis RS]